MLRTKEKYDAIVGDYALDSGDAEEVYRGCFDGLWIRDVDRAD